MLQRENNAGEGKVPINLIEQGSYRNYIVDNFFTENGLHKKNTFVRECEWVSI